MKESSTTKEYRVLARKYRPQFFGDLIGQEVLVQTLSNSIINKRVAHAYLLTGVRGIGKTTTARLLAKALNCEKKSEPKWNFYKILINKDGKIEQTYSSITNPMSNKITNEIEKILNIK